MSHSVSIDNNIFAAVSCEAVPYQGASACDSSSESKQAFADTAPLARIREELKSDKPESLDVSGEEETAGEQAVASEPHPLHRPDYQSHEDAPAESESAGGPGETEVVQITVPGREAVISHGDAGAVILGGGGGVGADALEVTGHGSAADADVGGAVTVTAVEVVQTQKTLNTELIIEVGGHEGVTTSGAENLSGTSQTLVSGGQENAHVAHDQVAGTVTADASTGRETIVERVNGSGAEPNPGVPAGSPTHDGMGAGADSVETAVTLSGQATVGEKPLTVGQETANPAPVAAESGDGSANQPRTDGDQIGAGASAGPSGDAPNAGATGDTGLGGSFPDPGNGVQDQPELLVSSQEGAGAMTFSQALDSPEVDATGAETGSLKSPVQDVGEQILSSVQASVARGGRQMLVRLDPPELGNVTVRFQERGDQLSGVMEVSREETRQEVERALPQVLRSLQEAGIQVRRIDVVVNDQPEKDLGRGQLQQDAWNQQQGSDRRGTHPDNSSGADWAAQPMSRTSSFEQQTTDGSDDGMTRGRIDMLI